MRRFLVAAALSALAFSASALPTVDEVQATVARGDYAQAEAMMREVVAAKPGSARGHYVYAEILAHDRHFAQAADELTKARAIDPALRFAQPEKVRAFSQLLEQEQAAARKATPPRQAAAPSVLEPALAGRHSGVPGWVWGLGLAAVGFVAWRALSARQQQPPSVPYAPAAPMGGYGPAYPSAPAAGSGLLGTGLAVAGGVAAGMLAEKLLDGRHPSGSENIFPGASAGLGSGLFDDGSADNAAARDLEERAVDFGTGDGWDGGGDASGSDNGW